MRLRGASGIAGLCCACAALLLAAGGRLSADQQGPDAQARASDPQDRGGYEARHGGPQSFAVLPTAGAPSAAGDAPRIPLSAAASQFGAIVEVNGNDVRVTRRDGSELHLKGVSGSGTQGQMKMAGAPGTGPVDDASYQPPIIRDGEAWVTPRDFAVLLAMPPSGSARGVPRDGAGGDPEPAEGPPASPSTQVSPATPAAGLLRSPGGGGAGTGAGHFESFEVQKPTVSSPAPAPQPVAGRPRRAGLSLSTTGDRGWVMTSTEGVALAISQTAGLSGPQSRGILQERFTPFASFSERRARGLDPDSPFSPMLSYLSLEIDEGNRRYEVGDLYDPLSGSATGVAFSSPLSARTRIGGSVMRPVVAPGQQSDGLAAVQLETELRKELTARAALGADGSYYASEDWQSPALTLRSSVLAGEDDQQRNLWGQVRLAPALTGSARALSTAPRGLRSNPAAGGVYSARSTRAFPAGNARLNALGLEWALGHARAGVERAWGASSGEPWGWDSVSLSLFRHGATGLLRYVGASEGAGRSGLEWAVTRAFPGGREWSLSAFSSRYGDGPTGQSYRLATYYPVGDHLRARAGLGWDGSRLSPECRLEWRPARDQIVSVSYTRAFPLENAPVGYLDSGLPGSVPGNALTVQGSLAFGGPGRGAPASGRVTGCVRDDAGQGVADVAVLLDDSETRVTGSDGSYEFGGVPEGQHAVRLDPARLPADLATQSVPRTVFVSAQEAGVAEFRVTRLCQISGTIYAQSGPGVEREPLADVAVQLLRRCSAAVAGLTMSGVQPTSNLPQPLGTTTDEQGHYCFSGLSPGDYTVSLSQGPSPQGLRLIPPAAWSFRLKAGERAGGADFGFQRELRPVVFGSLPDPGQSPDASSR